MLYSGQEPDEILGAYRPEGIAFEGNGDHHAPAPILNEFKRRFGETQVDLSQADGRASLRAIFDSQPNLFDQEFREMLFRHTAGNPLYIIELLRGMRNLLFQKYLYLRLDEMERLRLQ